MRVSIYYVLLMMIVFEVKKSGKEQERGDYTSTVSRFRMVAVKAGATKTRAVNRNVLRNCMLEMCVFAKKLMMNSRVLRLCCEFV
jgi:hypothetical protein